MNLANMAAFGFAAAGLAALARVFVPWGPSLLARKPLACVVCMAGHAAWVTMLGAWLGGAWAWPGIAGGLVTWLGATGFGAALLAQTGLFVQGISFDAHGE